MIVELSLIVASGLFMAGLIAHKRIEASRGARTKVYDMRQKTDPILENLHHNTGRFFSYVSLKNAILLLNFIFVSVVKFFMNVSKKVHDSSSAIVAKASKKKEDLSRAGAASFYLKKIKEGKEAVEIKEGIN
jgi:hypothetical protein